MATPETIMAVGWGGVWMVVQIEQEEANDVQNEEEKDRFEYNRFAEDTPLPCPHQTRPRRRLPPEGR